MNPVLRIFISSPDDVRPERLAAQRIVERLGRELQAHFRLEPVLWERQPLIATEHFQTRIIPPSQTAIVVTILWSRLGSPLPPEEFAGPVTGRVVSGTEWEFEDAVRSYREHGRPEMLVYRKRAEVLASLENDEELERQRDQKRMLEDFWRRWFVDEEAGGCKAAFREFDTTSSFEELFETHLRELLRRKAERSPKELPVRWLESPFRGLQAFELEHAPIFFGRTRARNEMRECLVRQIAAGRAFVVVTGASGSGKSSLVKAGLLPDLTLPGMVGQVGLCRVALMRPSQAGGRIFEGLTQALLQPSALPELNALQYDPDTLTALLRDPVQVTLPIRQGLTEARKTAHLTERAEARLALVVDQLEELFTGGCSGADQRAFGATLGMLAASGSVWVIASLRNDFWDRLESVPELLDLTRGDGRYPLAPPNEAEILQIIRRPATEAGLEFETDPDTGIGLEEVLRQAAGKNPASLPLLEFTLQQLWQERSPSNRLTYAAYERLGGLEGALGRRAEEVYQQQPGAARAALPHVLRALVSVAPGRAMEAAARHAHLSAFAEGTPSRMLVEALLDPTARLLVADGDGESALVRVAHEALLSHWPRAAARIQADRQDLQTRFRLEQESAQWRECAEQHRDSLLLRPGLPLSEAEDLLERRREDLEPEVIDFVEASTAAHQAQLAREEAARREHLDLLEQRERATHRLFRRTLLGAVVIAGFAVLAAVLGWVAQQQRDRAVENLIGLHWASAITERDRNQDPLKAAHHFMRVAELAPDPAESANAYFAGAFLIGRARLRGIFTHGSALAGAVLAAKDGGFATWGRDGAFRRWHAGQGKPVEVKEPGFASRKSLLSPTGGWIVHRAEDGSLYVQPTRDFQPPKHLAQSGPIRGYAFDPSETHLLSWGDTGTAVLWKLEGATRVRDLVQTEPPAGGVLGPGGEHALTWGARGPVRLWDSGQGETIVVFPGEAEAPRDGVFSPDGRRVLWWDAKSAWLLEVGRGRSPTPLQVAGLAGAMFAVDGTRLLTWGKDKTARLWDVRDGSQIAVLQHKEEVRGATFDANAHHVLSWSRDHTARLWDGRDGKPLQTLSHQGDVRGASFTTSEDRVLSWSDDGTARIWAVHNGQSLALLPQGQPLRGATFSPDDRRVLTWDEKTTRLWSYEGPAKAPALPVFPGDVEDVWAGPDLESLRVLTLTTGQTAQVWGASAVPIASMELQEAPYQLLFGPNGERVLGVGEKDLSLWDATNGQRLWRTPHGHARAYSLKVLFGPSGQRIVTWAEDCVAREWSAESGRVLNVWHYPSAPEQPCPLRGVAMRADNNRLLTWSGDGTVLIWDAGRKEPLQTLAQGASLTGAAWSPDGHLALSWDSSGHTRLWDTASGEPVQLLPHERQVTSAAFRGDGRWVITTAADDVARVWDAADGRELVALGHQNGLRGAAFVGEEHRAVTWSRDGTWRLWDLRAGRSLTPPLRQVGRIDRVQMLPTAALAVSWARAGRVVLWDLGVDRPSPGSPVDFLEQQTGTLLDETDEVEPLTADQWSDRRIKIP